MYDIVEVNIKFLDVLTLLRMQCIEQIYKSATLLKCEYSDALLNRHMDMFLQPYNICNKLENVEKRITVFNNCLVIIHIR